MSILVNSQWTEQRISDSSLPRSYWPKDSGDPSSECIFYKYCRQQKEEQVNLWHAD